MTKFSKTEAAALIDRAEIAASQAFAAARPTPMIVGTPKDPVASLFGGDGGGFDESQPTYYVEGGVCGFAWVNVRPANSSFALKAKALTGARKGYYGGLEIRPEAMGMSQSLDRKLAACQAYATVLQDAGIKAYAGSRMD
jgi:hypothetical protein